MRQAGGYIKARQVKQQFNENPQILRQMKMQLPCKMPTQPCAGSRKAQPRHKICQLGTLHPSRARGRGNHTVADHRWATDTTTPVENCTAVMNQPSRFLWRLNSVVTDRLREPCITHRPRRPRSQVCSLARSCPKAAAL